MLMGANLYFNFVFNLKNKVDLTLNRVKSNGCKLSQVGLSIWRAKLA